MGVPIFCILLGFPVGWIIVRYISVTTTSVPQALWKVLKYSLLSSAITLLYMLALWGPAIRLLFDPRSDIANFGIPMILYEPLASFIGWIVLMVLISPFLQLLMSIFGAYLAFLGWKNKGEPVQ